MKSVTVQYSPDPLLYNGFRDHPVRVEIEIPQALVDIARSHRFIDWNVVMKQAIAEDDALRYIQTQ